MKAKTSYLSDEFKHQISEVSGQNKAREKSLGDTQESAVDKLNRERGDGIQIRSLEGEGPTPYWAYYEKVYGRVFALSKYHFLFNNKYLIISPILLLRAKKE